MGSKGSSTIRTTFGGPFDRSVSPSATVEVATACQASGLVDEIVLWDQLTGWRPRALGHPDVTPLAATAPNCAKSTSRILETSRYVRMPDAGANAPAEAVP